MIAGSDTVLKRRPMFSIITRIEREVLAVVSYFQVNTTFGLYRHICAATAPGCGAHGMIDGGVVSFGVAYSFSVRLESLMVAECQTCHDDFRAFDLYRRFETLVGSRD